MSHVFEYYVTHSHQLGEGRSMAEAEQRGTNWTWVALALGSIALLITCGVVSACRDGAFEAESTADVPDYTIASTEDLSYGAAVRTEYRVVVPGDPTETELRAVIGDVIVKAKDGPAFNAVSVGLFAAESEVDGAYTLGYAEFAPGGEWEDADTVSAGDYDAMSLKVEIY